MTNITEYHPEYSEALPELKKVRVCVLGSPFIKAAEYTYLPHPSQVEPNSKEQQARYRDYIAGAEFPENTAETKRAVLGKMRFSDLDADLPERIGYLMQNSDGDGTSLSAAIEKSCGDVLESKFHLLVADYQGLSDIDTDSISIADLELINPRATIKQYSRESITNWSFSRINGVMQLDYIELMEVSYQLNKETRTRVKVRSYLVLALDEGGNYYQQKRVDTEGGELGSEGERNYVTTKMSGNLKWLPVQFVSDEPMPVGCLPRGYGFLHRIAEKCLSVYIETAKYKETRTALIPTRTSTGWKHGDLELFEKMNGRDYVVSGGYGNNRMPEGVEEGVFSGDKDMTDFQWYFERSEKQLAKLGGDNQNDAQMTATEADIVAANQNALLESVASSAERAWARTILYCGMFEGLWSADDIEKNLDAVTIELPRDFATPKLTVDEVRALLEMKMQSVISMAELQRKLSSGGWLMSEAKDILAEIDEDVPPLDLSQSNVNDQNLTGQTTSQ